MRYFFSLLALVATATLSAQSLRINEVDEFTGKSKKATTFEQVGYNVTKLKFYVYKNKERLNPETWVNKL